MPSTRGRLLNFGLYQAGWLACVAGAARGRADLGALIALALVVLHVALSRDRAAESRIVLASGAVGLLLDSLQAATGRLAFAGALQPWLAPLWVIALWLQLGTLLRGSLAWLAFRPRLAALLGATGAPLAFWSGERLGAAVWGEPRWGTALSLALAWGVALPLLFALARRLAAGAPSGYRLDA